MPSELGQTISGSGQFRGRRNISHSMMLAVGRRCARLGVVSPPERSSQFRSARHRSTRFGPPRFVRRDGLLIAAGGSIGALIRWGILGTIESQQSLAVLTLNVLGSLLLGLLAGRGLQSSAAWPVGAIGFCGGLTTFSTFTLDVANRFNSGQFRSSLILVLLTTGYTVLSAGIGYRLGVVSTHLAGLPRDRGDR